MESHLNHSQLHSRVSFSNPSSFSFFQFSFSIVFKYQHRNARVTQPHTKKFSVYLHAMIRTVTQVEICSFRKREYVSSAGQKGGSYDNPAKNWPECFKHYHYILFSFSKGDVANFIERTSNYLTNCLKWGGLLI